MPLFQTSRPHEVFNDIDARNESPHAIGDHKGQRIKMVCVREEPHGREKIEKVVPDTLARELAVLISDKSEKEKPCRENADYFQRFHVSGDGNDPSTCGL